MAIYGSINTEKRAAGPSKLLLAVAGIALFAAGALVGSSDAGSQMAAMLDDVARSETGVVVGGGGSVQAAEAGNIIPVAETKEATSTGGGMIAPSAPRASPGVNGGYIAISDRPAPEECVDIDDDYLGLTCTQHKNNGMCSKSGVAAACPATCDLCEPDSDASSSTTTEPVGTAKSGVGEAPQNPPMVNYAGGSTGTASDGFIPVSGDPAPVGTAKSGVGEAPENPPMVNYAGGSTGVSDGFIPVSGDPAPVGTAKSGVGEENPDGTIIIPIVGEGDHHDNGEPCGSANTACQTTVEDKKQGEGSAGNPVVNPSAPTTESTGQIPQYISGRRSLRGSA